METTTTTSTNPKENANENWNKIIFWTHSDLPLMDNFMGRPFVTNPGPASDDGANNWNSESEEDDIYESGGIQVQQNQFGHDYEHEIVIGNEITRYASAREEAAPMHSRTSSISQTTVDNKRSQPPHPGDHAINIAVSDRESESQPVGQGTSNSVKVANRMQVSSIDPQEHMPDICLCRTCHINRRNISFNCNRCHPDGYLEIHFSCQMCLSILQEVEVCSTCGGGLTFHKA